MSRAALRILASILAAGLATAARGLDPHLDPGRLPGGCPACHRGHGEPRSPMLPGPQTQVCLTCHDSQTRLEQRVVRGDVARGSTSIFLSSVLSGPFVHPLSDQAFSRREPGVVTCVSCHSPHRGLPPRAGESRASGLRKTSPRDPGRFEFELCESCHGGEGLNSQSPMNISRLLNPNSRSYHPVKNPSPDPSPSVSPALAGREINCTDCHGNSDPSGAKGPHGSAVRFILRSEYTTVDGVLESPRTYALCYDCHDRDRVLDSTAFPLHRLHVVDERTSCATCHSPHGSIKNRALIRFGEETLPTGVSPSILTRQLAFVSAGPGSGSCHLTCHGSDHAPKSYGGISFNGRPGDPRPGPSMAQGLLIPEGEKGEGCR